MQAFDVFLFPSLFEGFGIVLLEAQASGLRCITSKDVVPENVNVCNFVKYISLEQSAYKWALETIKYNNKYERIDTSDIIKGAGFDIEENSTRLVNKYIKMLGDS